ncbi:MAG: Fe-S cluster assembly protein SufD [Armatimonadetes bacterium]|nr:Fe-S cluster assembly protein SufD [Armatimonadota bacterium]
MLDLNSKVSAFESAFDEAQPELNAIGFGEMRRSAMARFLELGIPTTKDEEWKFTSAREIAETEFDFSPTKVDVDLSRMDKVAFGTGGPLLVFVNGAFSVEHSRVDGLPEGVIVKSLRRALSEDASIVEKHLGKVIDLDESAFTALNTAFFEGGYFVFVPKNTIVEQPIYVAFIAASSGMPAISHPRNLLVVENHAQASVVESYIGDAGASFVNAVTECVAGEDAVLEHVKLQLGSTEALHVTSMQIVQGRASNVKSTVVTMGGKLVRNDTNSVLAGQGCECTINGLYVGHGDQHIDNHTRLDHAQPNCPSHELFKGVLADKSSAVFNGKIIVRRIAQKTDSKQSNMNLLLSDDAVINTKPQLEIFADDVRCTHGATIGRLDEDALFYLRSRGIDKTDARNLLIYAFASDVIDRIKIPELRESLEDMLFERFAEK